MTRTLFALLFASLLAHPAFGADSSVTASQPESPQSSSQLADNDSSLQLPAMGTMQTSTTLLSPSLLDQVAPHIKAGWNSFNDAPRASEVKADKYTFLGKQEWYLGGRTTDGWALSLMYVSYQYTYDQHDTKHIDQFQSGDPSVTLGFPTLWKSGSWSLNSQFRYYYPVSHWYVGREIQNVAYYTFLNGELPGNNEFLNIFIPRYFYEPRYHAGDQQFYWEDRTQIGHRFSPWFRAGFGHWTQNEYHPTSSSGFCMDIYPYADFIVSKNLYFGPRYSFPVVASGEVFEGPTSVSWKEGYAELFLQATM